MDAGQLNRYIDFQTQTTAQDAFGQELATWTTAYSCWASMDILRAQMTYSTAEFVANVTWQITVRYDPAFVILPNMRIVWLDEYQNITHTFTIKAAFNDKADYTKVSILAYELDGAA